MEVYGVLVFALCCLLFFNGVEVAVGLRRRESPSKVSQPYRTAYHFQPLKNWMNGKTTLFLVDSHFFLTCCSFMVFNVSTNVCVLYRVLLHGLMIGLLAHCVAGGINLQILMDQCIIREFIIFSINIIHMVHYGLWGNISWAHAISYDLINWIHLDVALVPNEPYDINGCFSGSATILSNGAPAILYTGSDTEKRQVQNLAFPKNNSDPLLIEWVKSSHNPILSAPKGIDTSSYRDPSTAWMGADGEWRVVIGSEMDHHGLAILYKSKDFTHWVKSSSPLHFSNKTMMWECPDFYPVSVNEKNGLDTSIEGENIRHVLKASFNSHDYYILGDYDPKTDHYNVDIDFMDSKGSLRYDYGRFYASKSFYEAEKKRRILWSWINEADSESDDTKKGWSGLQSIPRSIWLSENGDQLMQWPVKELDNLRTQKVHLENKELKGGSLIEISGITASQADVEVTFSLSKLNEAEVLSSEVVDPQILCTQKNASMSGGFGPFGLMVLASKDLIEHTAVFFRVFKSSNDFRVLMCADQSRSSLRPKVDKSIYGAFLALDPRLAKISLRTLIDHSIIESFGGEGLACITARVYPSIAIDEQAHIYAFNNGTQSLSISSLSAWSMKKAQIVPMAKRRKPIK